MNNSQSVSFFGSTPKHIKGISCSVKNCAYHDGDSYCTAKQISVGPVSATSCADTVCATFKQKSF